MGESVDDRCELLRTLANQEAHPESVPINALVAVPGTPLEHQTPVAPVERTLNCGPVRVRSMSCVIHWPHWNAQSVRFRALGAR